MITPELSLQTSLAVLEKVPDLYLILSPELVILTASDAYLAATLTHRAAIVGKYLFDVFPEMPPARDAHAEDDLFSSLQQVLDTKKAHQMPPHRYDLFTAQQGPVERHWQLSNTPVLDQEGNILYIIQKVEDITRLVLQEKRSDQIARDARRELKKHQQKALEVLEVLHAAFIELDHELHIIYLNKTAQQYLDRPGKDLIGTSVWAVFPDNRETAAYRAIIKARTERVSVETEYFSVVLNKWVYLSVAPSGEGLILFFYDRHDIKEAQLRLKESEALLRDGETVAHTGSYVADFDTMNFRFSEGYCRLFGESPQTFVPTLDFVDSKTHPDDIALIRQILKQAAKDKKPFYYIRRFVRKDGEQRVLEAHGKVLLDGAGKAVKFLVQVQDVTERMQAEEDARQAHLDLKQSNATISRMLDGALAGICLFDTLRDKAGNILDFIFRGVNKASELILQKTEADLIGKGMLEMFPESKDVTFYDYVRVVETGEPLRAERFYPYHYADQWWNVSAVKNGDGFILTFLDITEFKRAEETIQQMLHGSVVSISILESVRDARGQIVDFVYKGINKAAEPILRLPAEEVIGKRLLELHPAAKEVFFDTYVKVVETGEPLRVERYYPYEGYDHWFDITGVKNGDGFIMTSLDTTDRKKAEEALLQSKENLETAFNVLEAAQMGAWDLDLTSGFSGKRSLRHDQIFGYEQAQTHWGLEIAKRHIVEEDQVVFDQALARALETGELRSEVRVRWADGSIHWMEIQGHIYYDEQGKPIRAAGVNYDITNRKKAEEEMKKNNALLSQSEQLACMGSWEYNLNTHTFNWSEGMYRLFGLPVGSPVSMQTLLDFVMSEDRFLVEKSIPDLLHRQLPFEETLRIRVQGKLHTLRFQTRVLQNEKGQAHKMLGVVLDVSEVKRLEEENLQMRLNQQKALLLGILEAQEEERRRISESLHNGIGQLLYASKLSLEQIARLVPAEAMHTLEKLLNDAIVETRKVSHELVPVILKDFGLRTAVLDLCQKYNGSSFKVSCEVEGLDMRLPAYLEIALYRISQELVNNMVKHAQATEADVLLVQEDGEISLKVRDNGKGLNQQAVNRGGIGLRTIRDRVKLLHGTLAITSPNTGKGTQITIRIPVPG